MSHSTHTFGSNCRLAPRHRDPTADDANDNPPPIATQFFYTSAIPIDDPYARGSLAGAPDTKAPKGSLNPFSREDNTALEEAWLCLASEEDSRTHEDARQRGSLSDVSVQVNSDRLALLTSSLARRHVGHYARQTPDIPEAVPEEASQPSSSVPICCPELRIEISSELQSSFCAHARLLHPTLRLENVVQRVVAEMNRIQAGARRLGAEQTDGSSPARGSRSEKIESQVADGPSLERTNPKHDSTKSAQDAGEELHLRARIPHSLGRPQTPNSTVEPRQIESYGISGRPFARVESSDGSRGSTPQPGSYSGKALGTAQRDRAPDDDGADPQAALPEDIGGRPGSSRGRDVAAAANTTLNVPVGVSRLHMVSIPALQMKPIYWSPVNDIATVLRATWFYRDTMLPVPPAIANQLEAGYRDLRPYTETWRDEIRCAIDVGPLGEEKLSHRLWPEQAEPTGHEGPAIGDAVLSNDPCCAARCFKGEAAAQGSITADPNTEPTNASHKSFASYHVLYKDTSNAFLLKPSLRPSAYYGRRPLAKIMRGTTIGIPVVRGFDVETWERLHNKGSAWTKDRVSDAGAQDGDAGHNTSCSACRPPRRRSQITDLILVCHGIGQKFAERVESFHFTHAINAFRRQINLELGNPEVKSVLREDQNGIMILPVNWRHTLSLEDGGPAAAEDGGGGDAAGFGLKDIEPSTIPAVRSMISDVMFDIPFYMSHHKSKMIESLVKEANRVFRLWCRNNPGFHINGRVHLIGHSLGSAMAVDILSRQPTRVRQVDLSAGVSQSEFFEFDTRNLFLVGSPAGFFLLLEKGVLLPRRHRSKPGADPDDVHARNVTGDAGTFGCLAVDNVYNILAREDPIAYLLNGTIDPVYAASLKTAYVPSTSTSLFKMVGDTVRGIFPGAAAVHQGDGANMAKPPVLRLPSQLELEVHDFSREEIAERKAYLLNDNGQVDYYLRSGGGPMEIQYLNMLSAHWSYWVNRDFIRMVCVEVGRAPGRNHVLPSMRARKAASRIFSPAE